MTCITTLFLAYCYPPPGDSSFWQPGPAAGPEILHHGVIHVRTLSRRAVAVAALAFLVSGCEETLNNLQFKQDLSSALVTTGALDGAGVAGSFAPFGILMLPNTGTLSAGGAGGRAARAINASLTGVMAASYEGALGVQIIYTSGTDNYTFTGVVGWEGFNQTAGTVDEVVSAGATTQTSTPANSSTIGAAGGYAAYWTRSPDADYVGTSGSFSVTPNFSGSDVSCTSLLAGEGITSCNYRTGTMTGSFEFAAVRVGTTGSYTQTPITFTNLPSVKITIVE